MTALVVSDLHLGTRSGLDLLRREAPREALFAALDGVERLILLGDVVEMREGPLAPALATSQAFFEALRGVLDGRPVLLVPGNHDHPFLDTWLRRRRTGGAAPLGVEERIAPSEASPAAARVEEWLGGNLELAYPGAWIADGVYATHGHYLDVHNTVPALETLAARATQRVLRRRGRLPDGVDGYEAVLGPVYALLHELVQHVPGHASAGAGPSQRAYRVLTGEGPRPLSHRFLGGVAFPAFVAAVNRLGLGPVSPDLSGPELRRAALRAMGEVARRLVPDARHVIFGHTHRFGPLPADELAEWTAPGGTRLHNSGSWIFEQTFLGAADDGHPYWPGGAIRVDGKLEQLRLLQGRHRDELIGRPG